MTGAEFNCLTVAGPHHGRHICKAHMREELWVGGKWVADICLTVPSEHRRQWWLQYFMMEGPIGGSEDLRPRVALRRVLHG